MGRQGVVLIVALTAALAVVGGAFAAPTPEFDVIAFSTTPGKVAETELELFFPPSAPAPAQAHIGVPIGYSLASTTLGSTVAEAFVDVVVVGKTQHLKGNVIVDDPSRYATEACAPGTHAAVWVVYLTVSGEPYVIPLFVDPTSGTDALNNAYTIQTCFLSPDAPAGGAPAGARITEFDLDFDAMFRNPSSQDYYRWSTLVTPFASGSATPDPAATFELRSTVTIPEHLTIKASFDKKRRVSVISGRLTAINKPEKGIDVDIYGAGSLFGDFKRLASVKTDASGNYVVRKRFAHTMWVAPYVPIYLGKCDTPPSLAPAGCPLQTWSSVIGPVVPAMVPAKRR